VRAGQRDEAIGALAAALDPSEPSPETL